MIAIIDYGAGNILSVENALQRVGAEYFLTSDESEILSADRVILPGVGDASFAMQQLRDKRLDIVIKTIKTPLFGICVGMQLLCAYTEEGDSECLSIIPSRVNRLIGDSYNKVPSIGWSEICDLKSPLFKGINQESFVYFVHSYGAEISDYTIATSTHSSPFSAAINRDNFYGCQFHPEKSGEVGEAIIKNFLTL